MAKSMWPVAVLASDICEDLGYSVEDYHLTIMKKILLAYKKLHIYVDKEISIKTIVVPKDGSICLPSDFVYETKVGVLRDDILCTLRLDRSIRPYNSKLNQSETSANILSILSGEYFPNNYYSFYNAYRGGQFLGELYGYGAGYSVGGIYNIQNGQLDIGSIVPEDSEIVIEYKSDGISDGLRLIPTEMVEYCEYYAKMKWYADKDLNKAAYNSDKADEEYYRIKKLYSKRPAHFYADLMKERARPAPR